MVKHAIDFGHSFSTFKILKEVQNQDKLDAYETLFINRHKDVLVNNEAGPIQNSPFI